MSPKPPGEARVGEPSRRALPYSSVCTAFLVPALYTGAECNIAFEERVLLSKKKGRKKGSKQASKPASKPASLASQETTGLNKWMPSREWRQRKKYPHSFPGTKFQL